MHWWSQALLVNYLLGRLPYLPFNQTSYLWPRPGSKLVTGISLLKLLLRLRHLAFDQRYHFLLSAHGSTSMSEIISGIRTASFDQVRGLVWPPGLSEDSEKLPLRQCSTTSWTLSNISSVHSPFRPRTLQRAFTTLSSLMSLSNRSSASCSLEKCLSEASLSGCTLRDP